MLAQIGQKTTSIQIGYDKCSFFNIQKDTNQLEWKGNIEYLQQFARFEESLKNIRGLTQKMKCEQEDFVGKKSIEAWFIIL